jgi:general secretion pathway protein D
MPARIRIEELRGMKKFVCVFLLFLIPLTVVGIQQETPRQPAPGKKLVQTPFGLAEVDLTDPRPAVVVGPQPQAPPPGPAAAQPAPAAAPPAVTAPPATTPPPPAQAPAPAAQSQADPVIPIALRFDNQDIYAVIRLIADALGINYVIDPRVKGNVTLTTSGDLHRSDLLPILETILKMNGATMVKTGNLYNIVPSPVAKTLPLELQSSAAQAPAFDDQMVLHVLRMQYVAAAEMSRLLTPYLSEGGNIVVHDSGNVIMITDRRTNLQKLLGIVDVFDSNAFEGERVRLIPVKNTFVRDLVSDLQTIFAGYALSEKASAIRFVPMERLNSILAVSPNANVFPEVERWVTRLDQQPPASGFRTFVYKVRNGKARDLQRVLAELYGYGQPILTAGATASPAPVGAAGVASAATAQSALPAGITQQAPALNPVRIIADEVNNALLVQGTPQDFAEIERTLQQLDVVKRQVLVDAQVFEVVLSHDLSLGVSAFLQNRGTLANPQTTGSFGGSNGAPPSLVAQTFAFIGRNRELVVFLNAQENRSRVRTLSAPSVLVSDNQQAQFQVGAEIPVPTSSSVTPVQSAGTNLFAQTIQFRDTGVILSVKPQIGDAGIVNLDISQEVSQASANTTSAIVAPVIGKSSVKSVIAVQDGETIALSGFIRENTDTSRNRVPLLGDIPVVGVLFGNTTRSTSRTELIVLITPHVIRSAQEANAATEEMKTKLKEIGKSMK